MSGLPLIASRKIRVMDLRDRKAEPHARVRDSVCGMRVDEWTVRHAAKLDGIKYAFSSAECLERINASPERYRRG